MKSKLKKVGIALLLTFLVSSTSIIEENEVNAQRTGSGCWFLKSTGCDTGGNVACAVCG